MKGASKLVRLGVVGIGRIGSRHVESVLAGRVERCTLSAICDVDATRTARFPGVPAYARSDALVRSGLVDALLIATPHFDHTAIGIDALSQGLHVLVEKPISVHKPDCERLLGAYDGRPDARQVFAAMFQRRADPLWRRVHELLGSGAMGEVRRIHCVATNWYRSEDYYASSPWRATWRGEGGGVLINQSPHALDTLYWLFGMPRRVRAHCGFGKWHAIETEDEVTSFLEYASGATGVFVTSTGEAPGTNRLEVATERGRLVVEDGALRITPNRWSESSLCAALGVAVDVTAGPHLTIPIAGRNPGAEGVIRNFVDAILDGAPLLAPASEGVFSVEIGNAMLLSSIADATLELPLESNMVAEHFDRLIQASNLRGGRAGADRERPVELPAP